MRNPLRKLALVVAVALAFAPWAWERAVVPSVNQAQAQFGGFTQAAPLQTAAVAVGNGVNLDTSGNPIVAFQVSGTFVASINFEGSLDATNFNALTCYPLGSSTATVSATTTGIWRCTVIGIPVVRARVGTFTSGAVTVKGFATQSYFPLGTMTP